jgi:light-regulated signal transduction histidine kinase (bacteriophytochrome)
MLNTGVESDGAKTRSFSSSEQREQGKAESEVEGGQSKTARPAAVPVEPWFTSLVVHDLRTPLNVIGLSFRMIESVLPRDDPDVAEDVRFIEENFRQLEQMLSQLGEYSRLSESGLKLSVSEFNPRRLVEDLLENREGRPGGKKPLVQLDVQKSCPEAVLLDQVRARLAIDYALTNACAASHDEPVRLTLRGRPQRWIIEVAVDRPPPYSVATFDLRPHSYERLCGSAAERRGMVLAIAARVSELFGGTGRLEASGRGTAIILDWPARITGASASA